MKRVIASLFGTVAGLVMLLSFKTQVQSIGAVAAPVTTTGGNNGNGATTTTNGSSSNSGSGSDDGSNSDDGSKSGKSSNSGTSTNSGTSSSGTGSSASGTYTGDTVNTQWGPVQVQITVTNGKIASANAVVYPSGNSRDQQINAYAIPQLNSEAVNASSAQINMVSGATFTSTGYIGSLQSALNKAGL